MLLSYMHYLRTFRFLENIYNSLRGLKFYFKKGAGFNIIHYCLVSYG